MRASDAGLTTELADLEARQLYRSRRVVSRREAGARVELDGRTLLNFCSNDYLGLAGDQRIGEAMKAGVDRWGTGATAAHLVTGHTAAHHALEEDLARVTGRDRALLFSTGYMANLGVFAALAGRRDLIVEDRLNHASLLDAARLSGARVRRFRHADPAAADARLSTGTHGRSFVVTDGVFSMDGDVAPLGELSTVSSRHGAWLVVDDAHGFGVIGSDGTGSLSQAGLSQSDVPVLIATLGKAIGTFGAFVAGSEAVIETLIQRARTYIYTTAPPPAVAEATRRALDIAFAETWRRDRLVTLIKRLRRGAERLGLAMTDSRSPIQPILLGEPGPALRASEALFEKGFWVTAIRPPTVPEGSARLRITLSTAHEEHDVDRLLDALADMDVTGPQSDG
jgi:8-amino-7-oxononanoate synthase